MINKTALSKNKIPLIKNLKKTIPRFCDKKTLKNVLKYLHDQDNIVKSDAVFFAKQKCKIENSTEYRTDHQIKLRCRQQPNLIQELRKALIKQDLNESAALLMILCHPGLKLYDSFILKAFFFLMFCHPKSSFSLIQNFIRKATGYILDEDINKFIKILFCLRKSALSPLKSGKYIRKNGDYKVTRDIEFENIS